MAEQVTADDLRANVEAQQKATPVLPVCVLVEVTRGLDLLVNDGCNVETIDGAIYVLEQAIQKLRGLR